MRAGVVIVTREADIVVTDSFGERVVTHVTLCVSGDVVVFHQPRDPLIELSGFEPVAVTEIDVQICLFSTPSFLLAHLVAALDDVLDEFSEYFPLALVFEVGYCRVRTVSLRLLHVDGWF